MQLCKGGHHEAAETAKLALLEHAAGSGKRREAVKSAGAFALEGDGDFWLPVAALAAPLVLFRASPAGLMLPMHLSMWTALSMRHLQVWAKLC